MKKTKNPATLQIESEFRKHEYRYLLYQRMIYHILNIDRLTKEILLKIAKEMKEEKITALSRDEQRYSAALKLWLCRNINLVYDFFLHERFENFHLDFPLENNQEYIRESYLLFDETLPQQKEMNLKTKAHDIQKEEFHTSEIQEKIIKNDFQSENIDFLLFELVQKIKFENIFN
jgi:hypothetical protein